MNKNNILLEQENKNDIKVHFSTVRLIYLIGCLVMCYETYIEFVIKQSAIFMFVGCLAFFCLARHFFKKLIIIYKEHPYEDRTTYEKRIDGLGFLVVIFLFYRAIGGV